MACARISVSVKRVPSVSVPIRRISTTTILNTRPTSHIKTTTKFNPPRTKLVNPTLIPSYRHIIFSRNYATSAKDYEDQITAQIQQKDFDTAEKTFKAMRDQKVNPSQPLLSSMIVEFSAAGRSDKSLEYYDVLRKLGFSPDEKILNIVVSSLSQKFKSSAKPKEPTPQPQLQQAPPQQQAAAPKPDFTQQLMELESRPEILDEEVIDDEEEYDEDDEEFEDREANLTDEQLADHPIVIVHETGNNVFATATYKGKTITSLSAGCLGFKGAKRGTSVAAEALGRGVSQRLLDRGYTAANIVLRTVPTSNSEGALKGLFALVQLPSSQKVGQLQIRNVAYHLCIAHNGCRPKKPRRV